MGVEPTEKANEPILKPINIVSYRQSGVDCSQDLWYIVRNARPAARRRRCVLDNTPDACGSQLCRDAHSHTVNTLSRDCFRNISDRPSQHTFGARAKVAAGRLGSHARWHAQQRTLQHARSRLERRRSRPRVQPRGGRHRTHSGPSRRSRERGTGLRRATLEDSRHAGGGYGRAENHPETDPATAAA